MKTIEQVRADYRDLKRAIDSRDSAQVDALLATYISAHGRMRRLWLHLRGWTPIEMLLYASCEEHDVDVAIDLVRRGANQYAYVRGGYPSAFDLAASGGDVAMCSALMSGGQPYQRSAGLNAAAWANQLAVVRLLLERGADPQVVLTSGAGLFRIRGDVLRALVGAGGTAPAEILTMLERRVALGD